MYWVVAFSKKKKRGEGRKKKRWIPRYDVMTLELQLQQQPQCPQIPHSDQQRQRGGRSHVDGADDFSNVRHNSTRFRLDPGYKARKIPERSVILCSKKGGSTPDSPCQGNLNI
jgi:hypothetical protein